jgi:hypothetical protein
VVLAAIGGVLYTAIFGDVKGVGDFLQQCYTAIIAGLFAHKTLWAPAGINLKFGASPPAAEQKSPTETFQRIGNSRTVGYETRRTVCDDFP